MRTPSLRTRVVAAGVSVVAVVLAAMDVFLYVSLRSSLQANLDDVLDDRAALVRAEAAGLGPQALATRLTELGLIAEVRGPDGRAYMAEPPSPVLGEGLAPAADDRADEVVTSLVDLPGGATAVVQAARGGMDSTLRRLVVLELIGTAVAIGLASLLLVRVVRVALRPIEHMAAVARRRAAGHTGERLRPDRPNTRIGEMASAYDAMLDELETTLAEAREAEAHSRHMEERSRKVIETATDAFIAVDVAGGIVDWNRGAERVFGWSAEEVVGRDVFDTVFPAELRDEHRGRLEQLRFTGERRSRGRRVETRAVRRNGSTFAAELILWATGEGREVTINAFVHDISERHQAQEALHRLAAIVNSSEDAIIGMALDGTVTSWNPAAERISGYSAEEMIGASIRRVVVPERHEDVADLLVRVAGGEAVPSFETVQSAKHGPPIEVTVSLSPIYDTGGSVAGASAVVRDMSEHRWLATTLDSTLGQLESALEDAQASEARSRRFLADAAHQLRTPIAGIRACAETLLRGAPPAERDRLLADLVRETTRASRLMASLLQMARLDKGEALVPTRCDVTSLCRDEAERARLLAPDLEIAVRGGAAGDSYLDPHAAREILANLLDNARRHARRCVEVQLGGENGGVVVRVADDGPGLPTGMEERVFERFVSLDGRGGSGLGLPIARSLARASGGELAYEDGAFVLRLPGGAAGDGGVPPPA